MGGGGGGGHRKRREIVCGSPVSLVGYSLFLSLSFSLLLPSLSPHPSLSEILTRLVRFLIMPLFLLSLCCKFQVKQDAFDSKKFSHQFRSAFARREEGIRGIQNRLKGLTKTIERMNSRVGIAAAAQDSLSPSPPQRGTGGRGRGGGGRGGDD